MQLFGKIFQSKSIKINQDNGNKIMIYFDPQLSQSVETSNQTVQNYINEKQFEPDQFLYVLLKNKKTNETIVKRKLNNFESLSQVLSEQSSQEYKAYIIVGYSSQKNVIPKINTMMAISETTKFIRSGTLSKFSESKNLFEDCQLRLHHDYLTYYKLKIKEKRVSFMPLQNASVDMINEKKHIFSVKDKFKSLVFKTTSKEDMIGWLLAINEAIRIRNAQIYMNQLDDKLHKKIKDKLATYSNRCLNVKDANRTMLLDEMGRKALRAYFKKNSNEESISDDVKILSIIQMYLYMCRVRREKGEQESEQIIKNIRQNIIQIKDKLPESMTKKNLQSKQELIKTIEQMMRHLDKKYKKLLIEKKVIHGVFHNHMIDQYKNYSKFTMKTLFGDNPSN